ncbi:hypothetical protein ColTof4_11015 [Colletotrichum tofieldiae]|nr:hypothetical protein ColTof3_07135 [Colletotrichum tofieldiae]GKT78592.1 hypothetical protein ColTof4_11015 [Colletotrichum tofieldiae]GKT85973.1 hypothetical protein Ct61P_03823 [Colletotrichum tofieldiae]
MQLTIVVTSLLAAAVSAREFILYDDANYGGVGNAENRPNEARCWNLNGRGDKASSVRGGSGCTTFFQ